MKNSRLTHEDSVTKGGEWRRFILLMIVVLPLLAACAIGGYGLFIWIMQMFVWGPPA